MTPESQKRLKRTRRYLIVGLLTAAPLWVTWLVFDFLFSQLSRVGAPWVAALARAMHGISPVMVEWLLHPWFQSLLAALITLAVLYSLGWLATQVIGQRAIAFFESILQRLPLVAAIYGGTKRFLTAMNEKPPGVQRVVLINFPSSDMKAVGLVTRIMREQETGEPLAVVYVPTSPNPTSGYIEIVPLDRVVSTDWTLDEAMRFVMTGGANAPDAIRYRTPAERGAQDGNLPSGDQEPAPEPTPEATMPTANPAPSDLLVEREEQTKA